MKLAVILVHYHTPELARGACEALAREAAAGGLELETLLVDNGSRPEDLEILSSLPVRRLDPGRNLGYAGGANLGVRETSAEMVAVMNPDVEVLPGCLVALIEALEGGAAAAGPRFYWDRRKRFLLPPTEPFDRWSVLLGVLARRGDPWKRWARRRWRLHARRHWLADAPLPSYDLSGALLAFRRSAWIRVGPFDEGYRLYFEETDWLQRLRAARLEARLVPAAEAIHLYAQSTAIEGRSEQWFAESSRRFRSRVFGPAFNRLLERSSRHTDAAILERPSPVSAKPGRPAWLEVSPSPLGYPAAARRLSPDTPPPFPRRGENATRALPEEIWSRLAPGSYTLRSVDEAGRELELRVLEKAPGREEWPRRVG